MDTTSLIIWILLGLLALLFGFLSWKNTQTWHISHVLLATAVFFAVCVFLFLAGVTLKTHAVWGDLAYKSHTQLLQEEKTQELLLRGKLMEVPQTLASLRSVKAELSQAMIGRGRVWRDCLPTKADQNSITIAIVPEDADEDATHTIVEKMTLYAFREAKTEAGWKLPVAYLGEYQVNGKTAKTITMMPTAALTKRQLQQANLQGVTWVLYEVMPSDSRQLFAGMDQQTLTAFLPKQLVTLDGEDYQQLIQQYLRDQQPANPETDPPERIQKRIKFLKLHEVPVDVQGDPARFAQTNFDSTGRAVPESLKQGEPTKFAVGNEALFIAQAADELIDEGIAELVELVYVRPLRDYATAFRLLYRNLDRLNDLEAEIQYDTKLLTDSDVKAKRQVQYRTEELAKLQHDLAGFQKERDAVAAHLEAMEKRVARLQAQLSQRYRDNNRLATELAKLQKNMADQINRRSSQDTALRQ